MLQYEVVFNDGTIEIYTGDVDVINLVYLVEHCRIDSFSVYLND